MPTRTRKLEAPCRRVGKGERSSKSSRGEGGLFRGHDNVHIRFELRQNFPHVQISEPGGQYGAANGLNAFLHQITQNFVFYSPSAYPLLFSHHF
jgi:hypothetical protein